MRVSFKFLPKILSIFLGVIGASAGRMPTAFAIPASSSEQRAKEMVDQLSNAEILDQLKESAPAIPRLNVRAYNYVSEGLHGSMSSSPSTVFPQAIGLAATWNTDLINSVASTISEELQGIYAKARAANGSTGAYEGLNAFAPNINIFRDPRWGRGQETYGEDPYLTSRMAVAFITGLQGTDWEHPKIAATAKHFAVHSGPEKGRYEFDAEVSKHDLIETYFPAFKAAVTEAHVQSVMCSYNRINGVPACANDWLLQTVLREEWGFRGYVVSDDTAIPMEYLKHHSTSGFVKAAEASLDAGTDLPNNDTLKIANYALKLGLFYGSLDISKAKEALVRIFASRFRLGMFDSPQGLTNPGPFQIDTASHRDLARKAAAESIVLLKNSASLLPLASGTKITAMGRLKDESRLLGNYSGHASRVSTPYSALVEEGVVGASDIAVVFGGLTPKEEGERQDRSTLELNDFDVKRLKSLRAQGKKTILVLSGGASIAFDPSLADAILQVWYPGEEAGHAIADVLYGRINPSGHLPVTFYASTSDLPPFTDYSMRGRTYRYFEGQPLFPFGFGLSFTTFEYDSIKIESRSVNEICFSQNVANSGERDGSTVSQIYLSAPRGPRVALKHFEKIAIRAHESKIVNFCLSRNNLETVDDDGKTEIVRGKYRVFAGDHSPLKIEPTFQSLEFDIE